MTHDPATHPWRIHATNYPGHDAPAPERWKFLIGYALLAPSSHNSQPWIFRIQEERLLLQADRTRALPVVDPHDRELTIACGSALFNLRIALRHFGYAPEIRTLPDAEHPDLLARVGFGTRKPPAHVENTLFGAIPRRHTNRSAFDKRAVDNAVLQRLVQAAAEEGAHLHPVKNPADRHAIAELVAEGDRMQHADKRFRRELAKWLHPNRTHSHDGMPGWAVGIGDLMSYAGPFVVRTFDMGKSTAARDQDLAEHSPVLAVLCTPGDTPADWLAAGQALQHVLLHATAADLAASFLNQPIEVEPLRPRLARLIGTPGYPQMLVRLGHAPEAKPMPRRGVGEVLKPW